MPEYSFVFRTYTCPYIDDIHKCPKLFYQSIGMKPNVPMTVLCPHDVIKDNNDRALCYVNSLGCGTTSYEQ